MVRPPDSIAHPFFNDFPCLCNQDANRETACAGWPSTAAPVAVATTSLLISRRQPNRSNSKPSNGIGLPNIKAEADVLSATTSARVNRKSRYRLSIISRPQQTDSVASRISSTVRLCPDKSLQRMAKNLIPKQFSILQGGLS